MLRFIFIFPYYKLLLLASDLQIIEPVLKNIIEKDFHDSVSTVKIYERNVSPVLLGVFVCGLVSNDHIASCDKRRINDERFYSFLKKQLFQHALIHE